MPRLMFLLAGLVEIGYLLLERLRHRVLLPGMALQAHEGEEAVRLSVFGFAVREAGKPSKPSPVCRAGVSVVPLGQSLCAKGSEKFWKQRPVFQPGLKVAGGGLGNGARIKTIGGDASSSCGAEGGILKVEWSIRKRNIPHSLETGMQLRPAIVHE